METTQRAGPSLAQLDLETALAGRYAIERELGQGGMGVVYLARDLTLERRVAIKQLPPNLAAVSGIRQRFVRESRTAAGLSHPNIVPIHAVLEEGPLVLFVMAFVEGESLGDRLRRIGRLPPREAMGILRDVAWALAYAHGRGVVHRDVKPDNILLEHATGRALLADFGIARVADSNLTEEGLSPGTPNYMSPEQAAGTLVDGRSDLYALGVVGFYALTGKLPFEAGNPQAVLAMHVTRPAPPVLSVVSSVPRRLAEAVDRCLRKDPDARWPTADGFLGALPRTAASFEETAPPVRNFHRAISLALNQIVMLGVTLPLLALLRPAAADLILLVLVFGIAAILLQLRGRAGLLVLQGYGFSDLRAAVLAERHQRGEELEVLDAAGRGVGKRSSIGAVALLVVGLAMIGAAWAGAVAPGLGQRLLLGSGWGLVALWIGMTFVGRPGRRRGVGSLVGMVLSSAAGERLFGWLSRGAARLPDSGGPPVVTGVERSGGWEQLGPEDRRAREAVVHAIADLEAQVGALERREIAIGQELGAAAWRENAPLGANGDDDVRRALGERRAKLLAGLESARAKVRSDRERLEMAVENLRLLKPQLRAGIGTPADVATEIEAARRLLGSRP